MPDDIRTSERLRRNVAEAYGDFTKVGDAESVERYNRALDAFRKFYRALSYERQDEELARLQKSKVEALGGTVTTAELDSLRETYRNLPHGIWKRKEPGIASLYVRTLGGDTVARSSRF